MTADALPTMKPTEPKGVTMCLIGPDGYVWATASDFETNSYGGFRLDQAQQRRAKAAMNRAFIRSCCTPAVAEVISEYEAESIVRELVSNEKWRVHTVLVGYGEDDASA